MNWQKIFVLLLFSVLVSCGGAANENGSAEADLLFTLVSSGTIAEGETASETNDPNTGGPFRIIGGNDVERGVVQVNNGGLCTGTMLSNSWVLTAEHCWNGVSVIHSVDYNTTSGTSSSPVAQAILHPNLDIALFRLQNRITVNGQAEDHVRTIYTGADASLIGTTLNCRGYGRDTLTGGSGTLREAYLVPSKIIVNQLLNYSGNAFYFEPNESDQIVFSGDSGGPCFSGSDLAAVHSGGSTIKDDDGNPIERVYSFSTVAGEFRDWVYDRILADLHVAAGFGVPSSGITLEIKTARETRTEIVFAGDRLEDAFWSDENYSIRVVDSPSGYACHVGGGYGIVDPANVNAGVTVTLYCIGLPEMWTALWTNLLFQNLLID